MKMCRRRVHAEFQSQVAEERELGLPVAPHMDATTPELQAHLDVNFINSIVHPLWHELAELMPGLQPRIKVLLANKGQYSVLSGAVETMPASANVSATSHDSEGPFSSSAQAGAAGGVSHNGHAGAP